jgi:hypothetical protein
MSALAVTRDIGAVLGAGGIAALMVPFPRVVPTTRRLAGLVLTTIGWLVLAASLTPSSEVARLRHHAHTAVGVAEVAVGLILAIVLVFVLLTIGTWATMRWPQAWLIALTIALPIRIPVPIGGASRDLLLPLYLVGACGVLGFVWGRVRGRFGPDAEPQTPLDIPIAAFICFTVISMLWTIDTKDAAIQIVFFYLPFPLLMLTVVAWWSSIARALPLLAGVTIAFATAIAALAIVQYETRWIFWNAKLQQDDIYSQFFRVNGIFFDPNIMGRYLAIGILAALAWIWLRPGKRELVVGAAAIVVMSGGILVSFSRSSCLMLMVGIVLLAWRAFGPRRTLAVGGIAFVILAGGAIASSPNIRHALTSTHRLSAVSEGRFSLMSGGVDIWRKEPVAGSGVGSFQTRFTQTETAYQIAHKKVSISHNTPITVLAELGVIGAAFFVWLCVAAWRVIARSSREVSGEGGWIEWSLLAIITGIFVHSQLYADLFEDPMLWTALGAALAIGLLARRARLRTDAPASVAGTT